MSMTQCTAAAMLMPPATVARPLPTCSCAAPCPVNLLVSNDVLGFLQQVVHFLICQIMKSQWANHPAGQHWVSLVLFLRVLALDAQ